MPDLEDIKTFLEVAGTGRLTRAARKMGTSKATVSRRLARLEAELGSQLLYRSGSGTRQTEAGLRFKPHAERIIAEFKAAQESGSSHNGISGHLSISVPVDFGVYQIAPLLVELIHKYPKLSIHASYDDHYVNLQDERYDMAIRFGNLPDSSLRARKVCTITTRAVASPEYIKQHGVPQHPHDLMRHQMLRPIDQPTLFFDDGKPVSLRLPPSRYTADNARAFLPAALAGLGIVVLPSFMVMPSIAAGRLVEVLSRYPLPSYGMHIVRPPLKGGVPPKVKLLTDILIERFGDGLVSNGDHDS